MRFDQTLQNNFDKQSLASNKLSSEINSDGQKFIKFTRRSSMLVRTYVRTIPLKLNFKKINLANEVNQYQPDNFGKSISTSTNHVGISISTQQENQFRLAEMLIQFH